MKLCVIGAGAAGLCSAKHGIDFGCEVTVFERSSEVGGTWVYTDFVGMDESGLEIHSSMHKGLFTNLPKEIMGYPSVPFPERSRSYICAEEVLKYYRLYAREFNLRQYIKFEYNIVKVRPLLDDK